MKDSQTEQMSRPIITGATVFEIKNHPLIRRIQKIPDSIGRGQPIGIDYISGSRINTYTRCEATYKYKYVLRAKEARSSSLLFGIQLHTAQSIVLKSILKAKTEETSLNINDMVNEAESEALAFHIEKYEDFTWKQQYKSSKEIETPESLKKSLIAGIEQMIPHWISRNPRSSEQGYIIEWHDESVPPFLGYSDYIENAGDHDEVVDLKTGNTLTNLALELNDTMSAYAIMNELTTGRPTTVIRYDNFVRNKTPILKTLTAPIDPRSTERLFRRAKDFAERVKSGIFIPKNSADVCNGCSFFTQCREDFSKNRELAESVDIPWTTEPIDIESE